MARENPHAGHRARLRRRFLEQGLDGFEDHQVLELLLTYAIPRSDTNPVAHQLMRRFGSLSAVLEADPRDLATVEGMGDNAAVFLSMLPQATRRYQFDRVHQAKPRLDDPGKGTHYLMALLAGRSEEVFYVLCLDTQCRVIYPALISEGTVKEAHIHPRRVVQEVLAHKAAAVILAHNHPSGALKPSPQDHQITRVLVQALAPLDIKVLDHIIIAGESAYSFAREGVLPGG
ncbi:MAG: DNA repair protein RadC [Syntrophaceae bacterium]